MSTKTFTKFAADTFVNGWHSDFTPRRFLNNGHLMTLAGNFLPRQWSLPDSEDLLVEVEGQSKAMLPMGRPAYFAIATGRLLTFAASGLRWFLSTDLRAHRILSMCLVTPHVPGRRDAMSFA